MKEENPIKPNQMANESSNRKKSPTIQHVSSSVLDVDCEFNNGDYAKYIVNIPPTPDNELTKPNDAGDVSSSMFTSGRLDRMRNASIKKLVSGESRNSSHHIEMVGKKASRCGLPGCNAKIMTDENGIDVVPCECGFKICAECYKDVLNSGSNGDEVCPGCKEPYREADVSETVIDNQHSLSNIGNDGSLGEMLEYDYTRYGFDSKRSYGYRSSRLSRESESERYEDIDDTNGGGEGYKNEEEWKPLTREMKISSGILVPYWILIFIRVIGLGLFMQWRIRHRNEDAMWLWGMSVVCEIWFAFSWLLDQLPKLFPVNRLTDLDLLRQKFETPSPCNPTGKSDLPGIDVFVSTADPEKEPPLVTANTILSILAADYPVDKLSCYVSDDGGALLTFEAMAEAASFARIWVPFCRKHDIEPRNPESYFTLKRDPYKYKVRPDFVKDRRRAKREYDEYKVRINGLGDSIRRRSDAYNTREEVQAMKKLKEQGSDELIESTKIPKATWMSDGTHWPGTWTVPTREHSRGDHASIIQVMLDPPGDEPFLSNQLDTRLPMLVYVTREKRPGYDHNKKAGAMNTLVRSSAIMSNGPFILNLDCDHYIYNSEALREGICFMMDRGGDNISYVQFPQRFEGIDPSDRYANNNTVFFDINMRALDGLQGPVYVGTGCLFRRVALYGFEPPQPKERADFCSCCFPRLKRSPSLASSRQVVVRETRSRHHHDDDGDEEMITGLVPKKFGNSRMFIDSITVAAFQGQPLADHPSIENGRPPGALTTPRDPLRPSTVAEAIDAISCWYEDKTEWGQSVGWIYGSVTEDVVTGFRMHDKGWRSVYCVTSRDAFRGTAPINLTDRLHQVLRWATGSVEIFFSRNNALLASSRLKFLQRIAYLNVGIYPFTSVFLIVYCFLPALSLYSGQFIVATLNITFLIYLLTITLTLIALALLEIKWSNIELEEWWRNEQFWLIGGTSAHIAAVFQGLLKVIAGVEISFTLTSKSAGDDEDDEFADLYLIKWTSLMIPPLAIIIVNLLAVAVAFTRTINSDVPEWNKLVGGMFFSFWVLAHLYPFVKGLMGKGRKTPMVVYVWSGLIAISISLLWVTINPPSSGNNNVRGSFKFL